jgi:RNA polymerase sigma-70 factor, ECF subfamily
MEELSEVIARAKTGDKHAFKIIYETFYKRIYRYCSIQVNNNEVAKDLCQETFIKAWKSLPTFTLEKGGTMQAFLFRIARNLIIDLSRKKKEYSLAEYTEVETNEDFYDDFEKKQTINNIKKSLKELDETDRQIIILRYFEELSTEETAKVIGMNHGALRVRVHRVLKKLKDILERHAN